MADFDHLTTDILKFWSWSWSKIFDHLTMTPGRGPNGQKIMVILVSFRGKLHLICLVLMWVNRSQIRFVTLYAGIINSACICGFRVIALLADNERGCLGAIISLSCANARVDNL